MTRRRALAHAIPTGETNLPIKLHGENTPALPVARKGQSGRVLLRPQRDHHAATVVDFCTAVPRAGIDRTYISSLERCVYNASIDVVDRLASALDVEAADLLKRPPGGKSGTA